MSTVRAQYVTNPKGDRKAVIIPIARYKQMLEDMHDLAVVAERRDEKAVSLTEMKRRLKRDGVL
jgi:hypothetical protein